MAHYDLEEQEQIDSIKTWWKMYGNLVTGVVLAGSLAVIGWQGWNWYQRSQSAQASAIYAVLEQAVAARDAQRVKAAAGELAEKFGGTSYAALGALVPLPPGIYYWSVQAIDHAYAGSALASEQSFSLPPVAPQGRFPVSPGCSQR